MTDIVRIRDKYYVRATSGLADARLRILKYGSTIAALNRFGDIEGPSFGQTGIFHREARHLSRCVLLINGAQPLLLNSTIHNDNSYLSIDMTNPDLVLKSGASFPRETVHIYRSKFVLDDTCYDELRVNNYGSEQVRLTLSVLFDADFADIFEVRGAKREKRGMRLKDVVRPSHVELSYRGLDEIVRRTVLRFDPAPASLTARQARYELELEPKQEVFLHFSASCEQGVTARVNGGEPGCGSPTARSAMTLAASALPARIMKRGFSARATTFACLPWAMSKASIRMPACPGSTRSLAGMESSPRLRRCGSRPGSPQPF
jgi:glycogen debranching enzyme